MNFQSVREANGNNVVMNAIATHIDGITYTPAGKPKQYCKFTDNLGEQQNVSIYQGKGQPIPSDMQGLSLTINISAKTSQKGGQLYYGGFWNNPAAQTQSTPQSASQTPQDAPQSTNAPQVGKVTPQNEITVKRDIVCSFIESNRDFNIDEVEKWKNYILKGYGAAPPDSQEENW